MCLVSFVSAGLSREESESVAQVPLSEINREPDGSRRHRKAVVLKSAGYMRGEGLLKKQLCTREEICKLQVLVTGDSI